MIERRVGSDTHELPRADLDDGDAAIVMEVGDDVVGHVLHLGGRREIMTRRIRNDFAPHHTDGRARFLAARKRIWMFSWVNYPYKFDTILSSWRSPSFVGAVVSEKRHTTL